jgi:hypothetical protein
MIAPGGKRPGAGRPPGPNPPRERISVRLTSEQLTAIEAEARTRGIEPSSMVRVAVDEWLELERLGWTKRCPQAVGSRNPPAPDTTRQPSARMAA